MTNAAPDESGSPGSGSFRVSPGVVYVAGEIDLANSDIFAETLARATPCDGRLVVDMTDVRFIGLCAVREITLAAQALGTAARVMVRNPPPVLFRVLDASEWDHDLVAAYAQRFDVAWDASAAPSSTPGVTMDAASARDLALFMSRLPAATEGDVARPVVVWHGGERSIVEIHATRSTDGTWQLRLGDQRSEEDAPDRPEAIDARLDDLNTMVWVTDGDRLAKWFNTAWLDFVDGELSDELGWGWMRHVHADDLYSLLQAYEAAQHAGRGFEHTARVTRRDGTLWWLRVRAAARLANGGFGGFIGMCEPIGPADELAPPNNSGLAELLPVADLDIEPATRIIERLMRLEQVLEISRSADPIEARLLRQLASRWVAQHEQLRDRHDDIVLAVGEAAANSIEHAYDTERGPVRLACELQGPNAEFRIRDWGTWESPSPTREHRGLALMHILTDDMHIDHLADGTEVTLSYRT